MLKAFVDDSGSGGDSTWFVLAGYVGTVEAWDRFDPLWQAVLDSPPKIAYFKCKEAERLRGQFCGFTEGQRDAKLDALIEVIGQCAERAVCVRVRQRDYDGIVKGQIPARWDNPYYFLFTLFIAAAIGIERLDGESDPVDFVFDSDEGHEEPSYQIVPELMPLRSFSGGVINVSYRDDKKVLPLQAADLLAWQIRRAFSVTTEPHRKHFDAARLCPTKEPHTFILDHKTLSELMNIAKEKGALIAASLGRSPDMRTW